MNQDEQLGSIAVNLSGGHTLRPRDRRLLGDLAHQAAIAFRNVQLTAELSAQVDQLSLHTRELELSRSRLISAGDAERRRIERAIAGQVIPHLVPLPARLRQLSRAANGPVALDTALLAPLLTSTNAAMQSLREITRGVFPAQLARSGLPTALGSLLARPEVVPGRLTVEESAAGRRFDSRVEAAAYFCVAEAARALDPHIAVHLSVHDDQLHLSLSGAEGEGLSLSHMRDRVEAAGGSVSATRRDGRTLVEVRAPAAR